MFQVIVTCTRSQWQHLIYPVDIYMSTALYLYILWVAPVLLNPVDGR